MNYIDIHTHKPNSDKDVIAILNIRLGHSKRLVLPQSPFSCGVHPWDIKKTIDINFLDEVRWNKYLFAIGECGFDKNIYASYPVQKSVFIKQVEISESLQKPLIIHCVGYFNELMSLIKTVNPSERWIIHGFTGHPQLAKQLVDSGLMLSFGKAIFDEAGKTTDSFSQIPEESFFLETDESDINIRDIYSRASEIKGISNDNIIKLIYNNFIKTFKQKDEVA